MRRDDDLVRAEDAKRVLDRLDGIVVADLPAGIDLVGGERRERLVEAILRGGARVVLIRCPVAEPGVERGRDDQYLRASLARPGHHFVAERAPQDGLVRDD